MGFKAPKIVRQVGGAINAGGSAIQRSLSPLGITDNPLTADAMRSLGTSLRDPSRAMGRLDDRVNSNLNNSWINDPYNAMFSSPQKAARAGAVAGTFAMPIVGTAIGAGLGYGLGTMTSAPKQEAIAAERAAEDEQREIAAEMATRDANSRLVSESFGDPSTAGGMRNRLLLNTAMRRSQDAVRNQGQAGIANSLAAQARASRVAASRGGTAGSSMDAANRAGVLGSALASRGALGSSLIGLQANQLKGLASNRAQLESVARGGGGYDAIRAADAQAAALGEAAGNVYPMALGNTIALGGDVLGSALKAEAQGFQGLGITTPRRGGATGTRVS